MLMHSDLAASPVKGLREARERQIRPAVGYWRPIEVVKDSHLSTAEKREILSSWASDACAVENRPDLRWLLGTQAPVPIDEVLQALVRLDRLELDLH